VGLAAFAFSGYVEFPGEPGKLKACCGSPEGHLLFLHYGWTGQPLTISALHMLWFVLLPTEVESTDARAEFLAMSFIDFCTH
jgi:hypothetical protein